jgi:hypothetical protein
VTDDPGSDQLNTTPTCHSHGTGHFNRSRPNANSERPRLGRSGRARSASPCASSSWLLCRGQGGDAHLGGCHGGAGERPATVVLVHCAAHGAWAWERVVRTLRGAAVDVVAVDLRGKGTILVRSSICTVTQTTSATSCLVSTGRWCSSATRTVARSSPRLGHQRTWCCWCTSLPCRSARTSRAPRPLRVICAPPISTRATVRYFATASGSATTARSCASIPSMAQSALWRLHNGRRAVGGHPIGRSVAARFAAVRGRGGVANDALVLCGVRPGRGAPSRSAADPCRALHRVDRMGHWSLAVPVAARPGRRSPLRARSTHWRELTTRPWLPGRRGRDGAHEHRCIADVAGSSSVSEPGCSI